MGIGSDAGSSADTNSAPKSYGGNIKKFFATPWSGPDMDAWDWFMLVGLLMVFYIAWRFILVHIIQTVEQKG